MADKVIACKQGDDSVCLKTYPMGCCSRVTVKSAGKDGEQRAIYEAMGYPIKVD